MSANERLGPLVHRAAHHGALILVTGSVVFILGMVVTQIGYGSSYSLSQNYISDLGNTQCGTFSGRSVCSPWHDVFNASIIVLGLCVMVAAVLLKTAFPSRSSRTVGLASLFLGGLGAAGVGIFPENIFGGSPHIVSALVAFLFGNVALLVLGFAMFRDTRWNGFRTYTVFSGLVGLIALILFQRQAYFAIGVGGMERLIVAPILLWGLVAGLHLARIPTYAPASLPKGGSA